MANFDDWDKTTPLNTDSVSLGDDQLRSLKSSMQAWWEDEHYGTDGSTTSAGEHKLGSGRCFVGPASQLSNPNAAGWLFHNTTDDSFWVAAPSSSTWKQVSSDVGTSSTNTFTVRQHWETSAVTSISVWQGGDANYRFEIDNNGDLWWGSGSATPDVQIYRAAANHLATPDVVLVGGLQVSSSDTINTILSATTGAWTPGSGTLASLAYDSTPITVTGAAVGDLVLAPQIYQADSFGLRLTGYVSATNVVTLVCQNTDGSTQNPTSRTPTVLVVNYDT